MLGSLLPFLVFLAGVSWLAWLGAPDERGFWPIQLAAIAAGLALAKDRHRYCDELVRGMAQPIVGLMIMAWMLAGVLGTLMGATGFIQTLVWVAYKAHVAGGGYVATAFIICCVVSTSTGTSLGTILLCGPLLYPAGGSLHAEPAMLMGAILAGATFGDSISPMSDTTIASSGTQNADIGGVVRSRLKYVIPAGLLAGIVLSALGNGEGAVAGGAITLSGNARSLPMLLIPLLVVALLLAKRHLIEGLMVGVATSAGLGLVLGLIKPAQLVYVDTTHFIAKGLILDGMQRAVGVAVFTLLLIGLVATLKATELMERMISFARRHAKHARDAEFWIFASVSAAVLLTTHSVVAMLTVGDFAKETGERMGLSAYRRANLLDMTVCTYPFALPYFIPTILAASATSSGADFGMPKLSPWTVGIHNAYSIILFVVVIGAIVTGYGRKEAAVEEMAVAE
jgi:Na+/H+ antiporter NhaC